MNNQHPNFETLLPDLQAYVEGSINKLRTEAGLPPAEANDTLPWAHRSSHGYVREASTIVRSGAGRLVIYLWPGEMGVEVQSDGWRDLDCSFRDLDNTVDDYAEALGLVLPLAWRLAGGAA